LEFLLLELVDAGGLVLALGPCFLAEVDQEHAETISNHLRAKPVEIIHHVIIKQSCCQYNAVDKEYIIV
jgi:hypothetical protein